MEKIGFKLIEKEKREFAGEISISRQNNHYMDIVGIKKMPSRTLKEQKVSSKVLQQDHSSERD